MSETILVLAPVVPYLRRGLLRELGSAAERLAILTSEGIVTDELVYRSAVWSIDATRVVLEKIKVVEPASQEHVELDSTTYPFLVFKVLEVQHRAEVRRGQDAEADGFTPSEKGRALAELVSILREQMVSSATIKQEEIYLGYRQCFVGSDRASQTRRKSPRLRR